MKSILALAVATTAGALVLTGCSSLSGLYANVPLLPAAKVTYCATQDVSIRVAIREKYNIPVVVDCGLFSILYDEETGEEIVVVNEEETETETEQKESEEE